ncbi:MAG: alpha/beta hydrolase [Alphaproteobacteria bacterium]|nr:alpha/beta hydrolase [Alphaproteobacteria bacterium]
MPTDASRGVGEPSFLTLQRPSGPMVLEVLDIAGANPAIVLLHEGLGSVSLWRQFPTILAAASGRRVFAYSRQGYGASGPAEAPRDVDYLHREAWDWLPAVLQAVGIEHPVLVGHSDGASIALIHAARHPVSALAVMAPHVMVEPITLAGIRAAQTLWRETDFPQRLGRHHRDADSVFWAWQTIWLDPRFAAWDIQDLLPEITAPVLAIQGRDDEYGTLDQLERIATRCAGAADVLALARCGHTPWRDRLDLVLPAVLALLPQVPSAKA